MARAEFEKLEVPYAFCAAARTNVEPSVESYLPGPISALSTYSLVCIAADAYMLFDASGRSAPPMVTSGHPRRLITGLALRVRKASWPRLWRTERVK